MIKNIKQKNGQRHVAEENKGRKDQLEPPVRLVHKTTRPSVWSSWKRHSDLALKLWGIRYKKESLSYVFLAFIRLLEVCLWGAHGSMCQCLRQQPYCARHSGCHRWALLKQVDVNRWQSASSVHTRGGGDSDSGMYAKGCIPHRWLCPPDLF